jgi:hypothetical protein
VKRYVAAVEALRKMERQDETHNSPPKLVAKLIWVPVISFPVMRLMPYYAETGRSRPLLV